jgi:F420H(2)-dependent quinone reductase
VVPIRSSRRGVVSYEDANPLHRSMRWQAGTAPMARLWARTLHHLDRLVFRLTKGRHSFVNLITGLPVVMLTTTGAKSGKARTLPVLGIPDGERMVVVASNWAGAASRAGTTTCEPIRGPRSAWGARAGKSWLTKRKGRSGIACGGEVARHPPTFREHRKAEVQLRRKLP